MKRLKLLKMITTIISDLFTALLIVTPIVAIVVSLKISGDGLTFQDKKYTSIGTGLIVSSFFKYGLYVVLLYCLNLFRNTLNLFSELKFFHVVIVKLFNTIGKYLIIVSIGFSLVSLIPINYSYTAFYPGGFSIYNNSDVNFSINFVLNSS